MFDAELIVMDRDERISAMNLPIGLGDQNRKYYYHAKLNDDNVIMHELQEPPDAMRAADVTTTLEWAEDAMKTLMTIPPGVRKMVTESTEEYAGARRGDRHDGALQRAGGGTGHERRLL